MHKNLLLFLAFGLLSCSTSVNVLTYNIYHGENAYKKGKSNLTEISAIINDTKPQIVFLQEVDSMTNRSTEVFGTKTDVARKLGQMTGRQGYFSKAIDFSDGGYGEGILLKQTNEIIRLKLPNPKGGEVRSLIAVKEKFRGKKILFAGTHLCHQFAENKMVQLKTIVDLYQEENLPMIISGDFNLSPDSEEYAYMTQYFYDAAVLAGNIEDTYSSEKPKIRIDYIFLSKNTSWKVKELKVIGSLASDHLPLFGKIRF